MLTDFILIFKICVMLTGPWLATQTFRCTTTEQPYWPAFLIQNDASRFSYVCHANQPLLVVLFDLRYANYWLFYVICCTGLSMSFFKREYSCWARLVCLTLNSFAKCQLIIVHTNPQFSVCALRVCVCVCVRTDKRAILWYVCERS